MMGGTNWEKWLDDAIEQVKEASDKVYLSTKGELISYYRSKNPERGRGSWKQKIIEDLIPIAHLSKKSLEKRFDAQRRDNPEPRNAEQYKALGRKMGIPPGHYEAPPNGYHVHYSGGVQFSECEDREFDIDIIDEYAKELAAHPGRIIDLTFKIYMQQENEDEASAGPCDDNGEPIIVITRNPDDYEPLQVKRHKPAIPFFKRKR